jgi:hypothetical protein
VNTSLQQRKQVLSEQVSAASASYEALRGKLRALEAEIEALAGEQSKYDALRAASDALQALQQMGASALFWGENAAGVDPERVLQGASERAAAFRTKLDAAREARTEVLSACEVEGDKLDDLEHHLAAVTQAEEDAKYEFVIERELATRPYRPAVMPWSGNDEDRRRLRKVMLISLLFMLAIGVVPQVWKLPEPDPNKKVEIPDRLVQMMKKKQPPKPIEQPQQVKKEEEPKKEEVAKQEDQPKPKPTEQQVKQARETAQTKGVLAFKDSFQSLLDDEPSALGADARISNSGQQSLGGAPGTRSMIASQATGGSGGIVNASISRGGVGAGGSGIGGVETGRVESSISAAARDAARPVSSGAGPARTDEEIQIVFDRYKAALYRIYNRELRNDPTLRGKMVLAITIEPDGSVSACSVQSTDMKSAVLAAEIVDRVKKFNFGPKEGVPSTKILYPIDFLPAG